MSNSVVVTFVRHGESTDNITTLWSGWKDAPLTYHGINQARALGKFFVDTRYTAIYTSDLKRAFGTAQALYDAQKDPKPTFDSSELLREQHFGDAEGRPYGFSGHVKFEQAVAYPLLYGGDAKFPGGESMNELRQRARRAISTLLLPHVWQAAKEGKTGIHVVVVSHGRCISQMISELLQMSTKQAINMVGLRYLLNTAWTRLVIDIEERPVDVDKEQPLLVVRVTDVNRHSHTDIL